MTLVYAGVCSHAPGIVGRAHLVDNEELRDKFYAAFDAERQKIEDTKPDALIVVGAEHFANFFMDNMPAFCIGMANNYEGPIEDPERIKIPRVQIPGNADLSKRLTEKVMATVDVAYAEEWRFDHAIMVPLHFLTPRYDLPIIPVNINCQGPPLTPPSRAWALGVALRAACDSVEERIAIVGTGGLSHWPATPNAGKINEEWDRDFLDRLMRNDKDALLDYTDEETYREAGQGGFEIRTFISIAAAAGGKGKLQFYTAEFPVFSVGCTVARFDTGAVPAQV